jgi:hypothetical protein
MSCRPLPSPLTRFDAAELKAICWPLSEIDGKALSPLACPPLGATDTRRVDPATTSRTKMSDLPLVSPDTRLVAMEKKAT